MFGVAIALAVGVVAVLSSADKAKGATDATKAVPAGDGKGAAKPGETKVMTPDEAKAAGRAEALAEVKAEKNAQRKLTQAVRRAMGNSPRARVVEED